MLIVLEGNEAVFKSTVSNKLKELLQFPIIKGSSFEQSKVDNDTLFTKFTNFSALNNAIFDRFIFSNLVYADLYEDYAILNDDQKLLIEDKIRNKSKVFYLYATDEKIRERLSVRGDEYVESKMVETISQKFEEVISNSSLDVIKIDTTDKTSDEVVTEILRNCGYATNS